MNYDNFLSLFTFKDDLSELPISQPCANGDFIIATNGRIGIKAPKAKCLSGYEVIAKYPDLQRCFDQQLESNEIDRTIAIGKLRELFNKFKRVPKYEACNQCEGTGRCICSDCDTEHDCGYCSKGHTDEIIGDEIDSNEHFVLGAATVLAKTFEPVYLVCDSLNSDLKIAANSAEHGTVIYCADVAMIVMPVTSGSQSCFEKIEFDN